MVIEYIHLGITVVGIVALLIQNRILKTRIDTQQSIIENMERLQKLYDIDKLEKLMQLSENTTRKATEIEKEEMKHQYLLEIEREQKNNKNKDRRLEVSNDMLYEIMVFSLQKLGYIFPEDKLKSMIKRSQMHKASKDLLYTAIDGIKNHKMYPEYTVWDVLHDNAKADAVLNSLDTSEKNATLNGDSQPQT
jgi:hypothetical protein